MISSASLCSVIKMYYDFSLICTLDKRPAEFAEVLDMADEVILLPIYPARELPIAGVSSEMILDKMKSKNKRVLDKEELKNWIRKDFKKQGKVLITAGAGDIDLLVEPIKEILK